MEKITPEIVDHFTNSKIDNWCGARKVKTLRELAKASEPNLTADYKHCKSFELMNARLSHIENTLNAFLVEIRLRASEDIELLFFFAISPTICTLKRINNVFFFSKDEI